MKLEKLNDSKFENFAGSEIGSTELQLLKGGESEIWVISQCTGGPHAGQQDVYDTKTGNVIFLPR